MLVCIPQIGIYIDLDKIVSVSPVIQGLQQEHNLHSFFFNVICNDNVIVKCELHSKQYPMHYEIDPLRQKVSEAQEWLIREYNKLQSTNEKN